MLQIGKYNNVVAWNLEMRASVGAVYDNGASFVTTNVRYIPRLPREEDYVIVYPVVEGDPPALAMPAALIADLKKMFSRADSERCGSKSSTKRRYGASCGCGCGCHLPHKVK